MCLSGCVVRFVSVGILASMPFLLAGCSGSSDRGDEKQATSEPDNPKAGEDESMAGKSPQDDKVANNSSAATLEPDDEDGDKKETTEAIVDNSANEKTAQERIQKCAESGGEELDLAMLGLSEVPKDVFQLAQLSELFLYSNQLTTIPAELGQLPNLTMLDIRHNQIAELPPEITKLENLTQLVIAGNPITDAQIKIIIKVEQLSILILGQTKITKEGESEIRKALPGCTILFER